MLKIKLLTLCIIYSIVSNSQDFNTLINKSADTIAKKIVATSKKKVAITDFINIDQSITQLGTFLSEELSSDLSNLTDNQSKFRVLERANLDQIFKEKHLVNFSDGAGLAKELGKIEAADILIFATITDFDGYYRVVIKLLDTKNGDALSSYKVNFVKTPSLENLNKQLVKKSSTSQIQPVVLENNSSKENKDEAIDKDYLNRNIGDYCFINNSINQVTMVIFKSEAMFSDILSQFTMKPGETGCFYELMAGVYNVRVMVLQNNGVDVKSESTKQIRVTKGIKDPKPKEYK